ncbi:CKLF-like MARVEL transmembrane domain-containing protein 8b [Eucyclogobius newberryi]|uniref:CKLF-like MARVEL transmembrane domain-containing protein 8b n=1 Tax=Eucyclogobius newberryi TaxID=166745 RepID=UPI003B5CD98A
MDRAVMRSTSRGPALPQTSISSLALNQPVMTPKGLLLIAEILFGLLVWLLIGGTEYFHLPSLCWVIFVAILCWILTLILFIIYVTGVPTRAPNIPWTTLFFYVNTSATVLYFIAAVVNTATANEATRGRHNYKCWAASACFAFLTTLSYASSSYLSYQDWKNPQEANPQ